MMNPGLLSAIYNRFAEAECRNYSPLYFRLAKAVAADRQILRFLCGIPNQHPHLFFASVQYLTGADRMPANGAELKAYVVQRGTEIARIIRSRTVQTNEIGRCMAILPALPEGPLALIEVGASAGLCLLLDRFRYEYEGFRVGGEASAVALRCRLIGPAPLPSQIPAIAWRCGLDVNPLDLNVPDNVQWLLACIWADQVERRERLEAAIQIARAQSEWAQADLVRRGDLVEDLPALLAEAPDDATLVVFHSAVFRRLQAEKRRAFAELLSMHSRARKIVWISNEVPGCGPELGGSAHRLARLRFQLVRTTFDEGRPQSALLGLAHPHGWDLEWLT